MTASPPPPPLAVERIVPIALRRNDVMGQFITFSGFATAGEHFAVRFGEPCRRDVLVRVHSECITGDLFGSLRCDCGDQLDEALAMLSREGGYLLYLRQEGRGIGLNAKLNAYALQDQGRDTYQANVELGHPPDGRDFGVAAAMLRALDVESVILLTNNPEKAEALRVAGLEVVFRRTGVFATKHNRDYLRTKRLHGGHWLDLVDHPAEGSR